MVGVEPVMIDGKKIVARELVREVSALSKIREIVFRERPHERVLAITKPGVCVVIREVDSGMAVNDIDDDGDPMLVANIDQGLEVGPASEALVHTEIADRQITPVNGRADIRQGHDLDRIHAKVGEIGNDLSHLIQVAPKLGDINFVYDEVGEIRRAPLVLVLAPAVRLVA